MSSLDACGKAPVSPILFQQLIRFSCSFAPCFPHVVENGVEKKKFYTENRGIICRIFLTSMAGQDIFPKTPVEKSDKPFRVFHKACGNTGFPSKLHNGLWKAMGGCPQYGNGISSTTTAPVALDREFRVFSVSLTYFPQFILRKSER